VDFPVDFERPCDDDSLLAPSFISFSAIMIVFSCLFENLVGA
jgi:hypothetical protein